jgi:hypothetical protein
MLSNLSKNQMIAIGAVVVIVLLGIVLLVRRNNDQEEYKEIVEVLDIMKEQENRDNFKLAKEKLPENISNEQNPRSKTLSFSKSSILDTLYTEIPIKAVVVPLIINIGGNVKVSVENIFYDDVDLWFVSTQRITRLIQNKKMLIIRSYIVKYSPNGMTQSFTYSGEAKDFMKIHPSQLILQTNPFVLQLASNIPNSNKNIFETVILPLFKIYGSSMLPNFSNEQKERIFNTSNIDVKMLINALSTNELEFRKMIRNSRLQLREMEQERIINDETKNQMIATEIARFMTRKDIVNNFSIVVDQLSAINVNSCDVDMLKAYNQILATYKEMLMRLAGSMRTNFQTYAKYCESTGQSEQFQELVQHLRDIFTMNKAIQDMARPIDNSNMFPIERKSIEDIIPTINLKRNL